MSTPTPTPRPALKATGMRRRYARCLETELAEAKAECERLQALGSWAHTCIHHTDEQRSRAERCSVCATAERDQLRAEVREARRAWLGDDYGHLPLIEALEKFRSDSDAKSDRADVLYQRACEVEHALRAEVERLTAVLYHRACEVEPALRAELILAENWVEHHSQHADDLIGENVELRADLERFTGHGLLDCHAICDQRDQAIARAEKAEAALADWSVLNTWGGTPEIIHEFIKGQQNRIHHCQDLEAECLEQARLLGMSGEREADLLGKLERAKADTARLDWLERRNNIAIDHSTWAEHMPLAGQPIIHLLEMDDDCEISLEKIAAAPNLRAAIDVAMIP